MLPETIAQIETRLEKADALSVAQRKELLKLLGRLKTEVTALAKTHEEEAHSIAAFADISTREATRKMQNPDLLEHSIDGLELSAAEFEETHPKLVQTVNGIATALANLGI